MKIAYLTQEFDVEPSRTVREEFYSAFGAQMQVGVVVCAGCICWVYVLHVLGACGVVWGQA